MPIIKLWCLPEMEEKKLNLIHQSIVGVIKSISEFGIKDEKDMTVLFPKDMMLYGLGTEIIIEVTGLFEKPERTYNVRQRLAKDLGEAIYKFFPEALVECFISSFNPDQGFWSSRKG